VMIGAGSWHLRRDAAGSSVRIAALEWSGIIVGALVIVVSFAMDYRNILAGGTPHAFHWPVFGTGLLLGTASYVKAAAARHGVAALEAAA